MTGSGTMRDWLGMTAGDLGRGIAAGEIDPEALCDTYLAAIASHPLRDRIYSVVTEGRARAEAAAAGERARRPVSGSGRSTGCRSAGRIFMTARGSRQRRARRC